VERGHVRVEIGKRGAKHHFAVDPSRPLPTTTGGTPGTPPDPFLYGRVRLPRFIGGSIRGFQL
jgi:hypothetical protein